MEKALKNFLKEIRLIIKKYDKATAFIVLSVIAVLGTIFVMNSDNSNMVATVLEQGPNAYEVKFDNKDMGYVHKNIDVNEIAEKLIHEVNVDEKYKIDNNIEVKEVTVDKEKVMEKQVFESNFRDYLVQNLDNYPTKAYEIVLKDGSVIALNSLEEIQGVLTLVEQQYVPNHKMFIVENLAIEEEKPVVNPEVVKVEDEQVIAKFQAKATEVRTSANNDEEEIKPLEADDNQEQNQAEEEISENQPDVIGVEFADDITIREGYAKKENILSFEDAYEYLTKEIQEKKVYNVESGDCLGIIAEKFEMPLSELLKINPEISENDFLQIGQEMTVSVPVPKLSVKTIESRKSTRKISPPVEYREDASEYKNYRRVISNGKNGEMLVEENVEKINNYEEKVEVVNETVTKEPQPKIIKIGTKPLPPKSATGSFMRPIRGGYISSPYGPRWNSFHYGIDFATPMGNPVFAADGGTVIYSGWGGGYGYLVKIDHGNGFVTYYGHNSKLYVKVGQKVAKGEQIAAIGSTGNSTGPHVHFEVRLKGNPVNPARYLD